MRLTMKARQEVTKATAGQYRGASKKEKSRILDQFVATTGYSRWYARLVLRHEGRRVQTDKQTIVVVERKSRPVGCYKQLAGLSNAVYIIADNIDRQVIYVT